MKIFSFIFARGGSKGLPKKNIKILKGKPLIQYSIDIAKASPSISKVFVSTENAQISSIAKECGAIVITRPKYLTTDKSPEWDSWRHSINWVKKNYSDFDYFVSLPSTSPLRCVNDIEKALIKLKKTQADICISITPSNRSPFFNMVKKNSEGFLEIVNGHEKTIINRQEAPKIFDITTVVYAAKPSFIMENYGIFSGNVTYIEVPRSRGIDIDDIYDFKLAEIILRENR